MYTATLKEKTVERAKQRIKVVVTYTEGEVSFDREFSFGLNSTVEEMKRAAKRYLDELNGAEELANSLTDLDYIEPTEDTPTAEEAAKTAWEQDKAKLAQLQELIDMGVFDGTETQIVDLRAKVKADFKAAYLN